MVSRERDDKIYYARLAEQGERYEDMIGYMKEVANVSHQNKLTTLTRNAEIQDLSMLATQVKPTSSMLCLSLGEFEKWRKESLRPLPCNVSDHLVFAFYRWANSRTKNATCSLLPTRTLWVRVVPPGEPSAPFRTVRPTRAASTST